jgi:hypothetical protein
MNWLIKHRTRLQQFFLLVIALNLLLFAAACSTEWFSTAVGIVKLLIPAVTSLLGLLGTLGIPAGVLTAFTSWSGQATTDLGTVQSLITQYQAAEATAQPGLLNQIDVLINTTLANLETLLPELHVTDAATQEKLTAAINEWAQELEALLGLIPVIKGEVTDHDEVMARVVKLKSSGKFKHDFNSRMTAFGPEAKKFQLK